MAKFDLYAGEKISKIFDGPAFEPKLDGPRLGKQHNEIKALMLDGEWRTLSEIERETGYPQSSISAQLRHLRKLRFGGLQVERNRRVVGLWEYRVKVPF